MPAEVTLHGASVTLRPATDSDIPELVRIRATPQVYERWRGGDDLMASVIEDLGYEDEHMFVIEHEGRVVGAHGGTRAATSDENGHKSD